MQLTRVLELLMERLVLPGPQQWPCPPEPSSSATAQGRYGAAAEGAGYGESLMGGRLGASSDDDEDKDSEGDPSQRMVEAALGEQGSASRCGGQGPPRWCSGSSLRSAGRRAGHVVTSRAV